MTGSRRFSQAISEGDGISVIAVVEVADEATRAEEQGAEAVAVSAPVAGLRGATTLPILWRERGPLQDARLAGADACVLVVEELVDDAEQLVRLHSDALELGLDCVVDVRDEEELELALERLDPEIFILSSRDADADEDGLDRVLDLLPDVPAGKLAIAEVPVEGREDVVALERAGVDAVLVRGGEVGELVGGAPPEV